MKKIIDFFKKTGIFLLFLLLLIFFGVNVYDLFKKKKKKKRIMNEDADIIYDYYDIISNIKQINSRGNTTP